MKATSTRILVAVSTFWMRATRRTPKKFRMVNKRDQDRRGQLRPAQLEGEGARADGELRVLLFQRGEEVAQVVGEGQRRGRDGRREAGEERDPARHEAPGRAVGAGQVDVLAAGTRED